ncbi:tumor p53-inducible nuclear 2 isoform X1 [Brachionus plicatilis]|uniref:Tumor p53-inducible nuclear 2 isoform X1 n=1 Tax=Brachionus plicatilis TaxID=10195 RepID=A0A3M7PB94_BRAPC|nr:tumor p53-inducible nuclear 2 isoform X1 [Brachionus plicatilis]
MFNLLGSLLFGNRSAERSHTQTNDVNTQEDWDIVDRSEEADKLKAEPVVYGPEPAPGELERAEDDNDVILGSFFERNEHSTDDQERYKARTYDDDEMPEVRSKDWLITPLPCLTSITASQRSVTENSELENLLIEHPSMSVFVTATSTSIIESIDSPEKSGCEKRKGGDSANSTLRRKGKKSKKSSALCNKENVRVLLFSDAKKGSAQAKKVESAALNGKQMTRCNKSSAFKSINVNLNKRKYHKLQQPSVL